MKRARTGRRTPYRYRRSPHLVAHWKNGSFQIVNYALRRTSAATPLVCEILGFCGGWQTASDIQKGVPHARSAHLDVLLDRLVELSLLLRSDRPAEPMTAAMESLAAWNPEAGFFHTATKDVDFGSRGRAQLFALRNPAATPMPAVVKRYGGVPHVKLPAPARNAPLTDVLLARRTSRRYSSRPIAARDLSTILALTAGVQQWAATPTGEVALKTSPSGGARHAIECYVVVRSVDGLAAGVYHYRPDRHFLERIRGPVPTERMRKYVPGSEYFASASAMVFFTAVFEREIWRYPYARAYRAILAEAGHVCQTLLLTATSLGLASYCVMGLADRLIEEDLRIDGITESVLYCAGVARPPRGAAAPTLPRGSVKTRPNRYLRFR